MDNKQFAFGKENFIILAIAAALILIGFLLMTGAKTTIEGGFDPAIFNTRRIVIAPIITVAGFGLVVWAIIKKPKDKKESK